VSIDFVGVLAGNLLGLVSGCWQNMKSNFSGKSSAIISEQTLKRNSRKNEKNLMKN
jgi:hypothetical protein